MSGAQILSKAVQFFDRRGTVLFQQQGVEIGKAEPRRGQPLFDRIGERFARVRDPFAAEPDIAHDQHDRQLVIAADRGEVADHRIENAGSVRRLAVDPERALARHALGAAFVLRAEGEFGLCRCAGFGHSANHPALRRALITRAIML